MSNENDHDDGQNIEPIIDDQAPLENIDGANNAPPPTPRRSRRVDFSNMSERERELVKAARQEEKDKLYKDQERLKQDNERLQKLLREVQNAPVPTTTQGIDAQNARIDKLTEMLEQQSQILTTMREEDQTRRRESELRAYAAERIADMRSRGEDIVEALVGGSNEDEIDDSIHVARAEYQRAVQKEDEKRRRNDGGRRSSVTVQANSGRPTGAPRPVTPNVVDADDNESISELTSDDAVRSGAYEKNRTKILSKLKRGFRYSAQPS